MNIAHPLASTLRRCAGALDKLPTPGELLRKAATLTDSANADAFRARKAELVALEAAVENKLASGHTATSAPTE